MTDQQKLLSKIKKLEALGTSSFAGEANSALLKASELRARYNELYPPKVKAKKAQPVSLETEGKARDLGTVIDELTAFYEKEIKRMKKESAKFQKEMAKAKAIDEEDYDDVNKARYREDFDTLDEWIDYNIRRNDHFHPGFAAGLSFKESRFEH